MNIEKLKTYWYPMMKSEELTSAPISKQLLGVKVVFVRFENSVKCFKDQCPHRGVALSNGVFKDNLLQCHYHGWSFNQKGTLKNVPGCINTCDYSVSLVKFDTIEDGGLIWLKLKGNREYKPFFISEDNFINILQPKILKCDFIHAIENFLDPMHTAYVHKNLLRSKGKQEMKVTQTLFEDGFSTYYNLLDKQNGVINKLFDKGINVNIATFSLPGFAKIEYLKDSTLLFRVSIFFVPIKKGKVQMWVEVSLPKVTFVPKSLIFFILRPFLELAFYQDKKILEEQYREFNTETSTYEILETDLVIEHLLYFLADKKRGVLKDMKIMM